MTNTVPCQVLAESAMLQTGVVSTCRAQTSRGTWLDGTRPPAAPAQASKSLWKAGPTSATMSEVVVARPCFWKACWLHCLVRAQAPKAATSSGLGLRGEVSRAAPHPVRPACHPGTHAGKLESKGL